MSDRGQEQPLILTTLQREKIDCDVVSLPDNTYNSCLKSVIRVTLC